MKRFIRPSEAAPSIAGPATINYPSLVTDELVTLQTPERAASHRLPIVHTVSSMIRANAIPAAATYERILPSPAIHPACEEQVHRGSGAPACYDQPVGDTTAGFVFLITDLIEMPITTWL
jgi:hypothetical protein